MKVLRDKDVLQDQGCDFEARADSEAEVVDQMMEHIRSEHSDTDLGRQLQQADQTEDPGLQQEVRVEERLRKMVKDEGGSQQQAA